MKTIILTLLLVIIAGCNNTTEPTITDATIYAGIDYMPTDTSIKYVYRENGVDKTYYVFEDNRGTVVGNYHKYNTNNEETTYPIQYQLRQEYWSSFYLTSVAKANIFGNIIYASTVFGFGDNKKYTILYQGGSDQPFKACTTSYSTSYLEFPTQVVINNVRYKNILKLTETSTMPTFYFKNEYYYAQGIGIVKTTITDDDYKTVTLELIKTYK